MERHRHYRFKRIARAVYRIRYAIFFVGLSLSIGTVGYMLIENYPLFDAWYMSVITLATVGFGEVRPLTVAGRMFTSLLILFNVGLFTYAVSSVTGIFAEGGFSKLINEFRMYRLIAHLQGHTIICGYGRHALEVSQELTKQGMSFVLVEKDEEKINYLREQTDFLFVEGDATEDAVLEEAGIGKALALVSTLPDDADNMFVVLSARQMNPRLRIISRANNESDERKIRRAGADHTVVPERIGGFYMATLINKPDLVEFFTLISNMGPSNVVFEEVPVQQLKGEYHHKTVAATGLSYGAPVSLVAVRAPDGQYTLNPTPDTVLLPDWDVVILGNPEQVKIFRQKWMGLAG